MPKNAAEELAKELMDLPPGEVDVWRDGQVRKIDFRKLVMDKDYVWKLEFVAIGRINDVSMASYDASIILDPTKSDDELQRCLKEAKGQQLSMENITGKIRNEMVRIHEKYQKELEIFGTVDFRCQMLKVENKPGNEQIMQLVINAKAAQDISALLNRLDDAAIVLNPV